MGNAQHKEPRETHLTATLAQHKERREEAHLIAKLRDARDAIAAAPRPQTPRYPKVADRGVSLRFARDFHARPRHGAPLGDVLRADIDPHLGGSEAAHCIG